MVQISPHYAASGDLYTCLTPPNCQVDHFLLSILWIHAVGPTGIVDRRVHEYFALTYIKFFKYKRFSLIIKPCPKLKGNKCDTSMQFPTQKKWRGFIAALGGGLNFGKSVRLAWLACLPGGISRGEEGCKKYTTSRTAQKYTTSRRELHNFMHVKVFHK